jgi:DNA-binding NarL/FixJ family response regulator
MRKLEPGQLELARLIEQGLTYDQMAEKLGVSTSTVKKQTDRLRWTLGVEKKRHIPGILRGLGLLHD